MKLIYSIVIPLLLLSYSNNNQTAKRAELILKYKSPIDFIESNREYLKTDYFKYFGRVLENVGDLEFKIVDSKQIKDEKYVVHGIKISAEGLKSWSYCEKVVVFANSGEILFESGFRQIEKELKIAECGVPKIDLESIDYKVIGTDKVVFTNIKEYYHTCAGQPRTEIKTLYLNSFIDYERIDSIITRINIGNSNENYDCEVNVEGDLIQVTKTEQVEDKKVTSKLNYEIVAKKLEVQK
jgi:hypothetical protein